MVASSIIEIPSLFQNKTAKRLTFSQDGIKIEKPLSFDPEVFLEAGDITAFRYGVTWTRGYRFVIGRQYWIEIKSRQHGVTKIKLKSIYGIKREVYGDIWSKIINQLWTNYFAAVLAEQIELYNKLEVFEFAGIKFLYEGINWDTKNKLLWDEIALSNYKSYFMVHHAQNPKQHKSFTFAIDWNALVLQYLLKHIVEAYKQK